MMRQQYISVSPGLKAWTLLFYLDGDNNLDNSYLPIFNQLESAAGNPNVNVLALWDRSGLNKNGSAYYKIQYDTDLDRLATYTDNVNRWPQGDSNMSITTTLASFVAWARLTNPAQYYALILSDHGSGLGGAMQDASSGNTVMRVDQIGSALASITGNGVNKIDVLYMDACLMGMIEDAYQVRNYVRYYVASENPQWTYTTAYAQYLSGISATTTPAELAAAFTNGYANEMESRGSPYTMATGDLSKLSDVVTATNSLAQALNSQMASGALTLTNIASSVQRFEMNSDSVINASDAYVDLYDFAQLAKANFSDAAIQSAAQAVMDATTAYATTVRFHTGKAPNGRVWNLDKSHGLSIFFPSTASSFYSAANYDFAAGATWGNAVGQAGSTDQASMMWGPMLVSYFQMTQPGGPDNPNPPPLLSRLQNTVYLPLATR